ncbi:MAG: hypothetical protein KGI71_06595 [Patescibacteria group bacterium]|nr:hypothetical protein [Patescibacteria group bacterium]
MTKRSPNDMFHPGDDDGISEAPAIKGPKFETAKEAADRIRREREAGVRPRAMNGLTQKLQVHGQLPGYRMAIVNDDRNRVPELEHFGWVMVDADEIKAVNGNVTSYNTDPGNRVRFTVGTKENGEPMYAYLMKLPEEIWQEHQDEQERLCARVDAQLMRGRIPGEQDEAREERLTKVSGVESRMQQGLRQVAPTS